MTAYGLFVEHYEKANVIWNGRDGTDIFFQNELPYDPPSQAAWMENPSTDGYPAFLVTSHAANFSGYGMGSYSFFNQGVPIFATNAIEADNPPGLALHDMLTIFLNANGGSGRDRQRGERRRRLVDGREPRHPGQRGELPVTTERPACGAAGPSTGWAGRTGVLS